MDPEMIPWFQVNWVFGLVSLSIVSLLLVKETRKPITSCAFLFFFIWGVWRLVSNYILNQWGLSALDAWNLGEIDHGLPNINITIPGWIMYGVLMINVLGKKDYIGAEEIEQSEKKEVQKESTEEAAVKESLEQNEKKVDDLFDDI